jgi:hypothetical protein
MGKKLLLLALLTAAGVIAWRMRPAEQGGDSSSMPLAEDGATLTTTGDDETNFLMDGIDTMTSAFTGWPTGSEPYQPAITAACDLYGVPVPVLAWLLWKECRYNPAIIDGTKRSPVGAMGIAQFMPATAREELGSEAAALDPSQAIPGAARYLKKLYNRTGTWAKALAAYNWGIGNVLRKGLAAAPAETTDYYSTILSKANSGGEVYA